MSGYKVFLVFFVIAFALPLKAQDSSLYTLSNFELKRLFKQSTREGNSLEASLYFDELLTRNKAKSKDFLAYAESLLQSRNFKKALPIADSAYALNPDKNYKALYFKALAAIQLEKNEMAQESLSLLRKKYRKRLDRDTYKHIKNLQEGLEKFGYSDSSESTVKAVSSFNTPHQEFNPVFGRSELWVGKTIQQAETQKLTRAFFTLGASNNPNTFDFPTLSTHPIPGHLCFTENENLYYFTACFVNVAKQTECKLFEAKRIDNSWVYTELPAPINLKGVSISYPNWVSGIEDEDPVIYYSANYPTGKGGKDIWYIEYNSRKQAFKKPRNCGFKVNTPMDERTPFYRQKEGTLYFSSNGHPTNGGYDIYKVSGNGSRWVNDPQPLPRAINSNNDDLAFVLNERGTEAYFISNRKGGESMYHDYCCDDLYHVQFTDTFRVRYTVNLHFVPKDSCRITDAKIYLVQGGERRLIEKDSVGNCKHLFTLPPNTTVEVLYTTPDYLTEVLRFETPSFLEKDEEVEEDLVLRPIPEGETRLNNILFDFDSYTLTNNAKAEIDTLLYPLLRNNAGLNLELHCHTDNKGSERYNERLSQKRAESVRMYLIEKGIDENRIIAIGYGETKPIAPNANADGSDNPAGRKLNRRVVFKLIKP